MTRTTRIAAALACAIWLLLLGCGPTDGVPSYTAVPDFTLTDSSGEDFGSADLRGKIWVADFIFASCTAMCPMLSTEMARVRDKLADEPLFEDLRFVSISVDPANDTPEVLAEYAGRWDADPANWRFLTGDRDAIWDLSKEGFRLAVGEAPKGSKEPLFHSDRFVLVDGDGNIRGYYEALDPAGREKLLADVRSVAGASGS